MIHASCYYYATPHNWWPWDTELINIMTKVVGSTHILNFTNCILFVRASMNPETDLGTFIKKVI